MPVGLAIVHSASALALVPVTDRKTFPWKKRGKRKADLGWGSCPLRTCHPGHNTTILAKLFCIEFLERYHIFKV